MRASPAIMPVPARGAAAQKVYDESIGVCRECVVEHPDRWQHGQLAVGTVKLIAENGCAYAFGFEHAFNQVGFGRMACGVNEFHRDLL